MSMPSDFQEVMRELFLRKQFFDMEIIFQGVIFKAHQAIACTQSSYFYSAICGGFKETIAKAIDVQEDSPAALERVLSFFYLREYNDEHTLVQYQVPETAPPDPGDQQKDTETKKIALNNMEVFIAALPKGSLDRQLKVRTLQYFPMSFKKS